LAAILVTHNLAAVSRTAERILYLDGRVVAWGLPGEILGKERFAALSASDHRAIPHEERRGRLPARLPHGALRLGPDGPRLRGPRHRRGALRPHRRRPPPAQALPHPRPAAPRRPP